MADGFEDLLAGVPLFAHCGPEELASIAEVCHERIHPRDTVLFREGDRGDECIVVLDGRVVVRAGGAAVGVVAAGGLLGEMSLVEAAPRFATATVVDEARCLHVSTSDFSALLDRMPAVARGLLVAMSRRLRDVQTPGAPWR